MIKIIKIGDIKLDNPLFFKESYEAKNVYAKKFLTLGGNSVIFESIKRNNANNITLDSLESGWISEETLKKIAILANDLGVEVELTTADNKTIKARFRNEEENVIYYEPLYDGSKWYKVKIKLAYV